ncbi:hypothetical protein NF867_11000 [Solitalea sp. MAHUQ-68]|uniref:Uncharacterized protein n=1 Tax=Solitalea agri TaxID=2953739 RepID=A0A9X2JCS7_9SPHI|nr:hypothetical protein [Solitalea agri]MCO4293393.1 hypothetical protein [Solitalea agri]
MNLCVKKVIALALSSTLLTSCASTYRSLTPETISYQGESNTKNVTLSYAYNVLQEKGNRKYARREVKTNNQVVAVKINNKSGKDLVFNEDIKLLAYDAPAVQVSPQVVYNDVKQSIPIYLLYLLLTPTKLTTAKNGVQTSSFPLGLILGPAISGGNMLVANAANEKFKDELTRYNLSGKTIKNGETTYGLLTLKSLGYAPLRLQILAKTDSTSVSQKE